MYDRLSVVLEFFAHLVVLRGLFSVLAVAVTSSLVVLLLAYYLVRFARFAVSWQPEDLVGAPRNRRLADSNATPDLAPKEDHESSANHGGVPLIGTLTGSVCGGVPQRSVKIVITPTELFSEISEPSGMYPPEAVGYFEIRGSRGNSEGLVTLTFVLTDQQRVRFYATFSKFDIVILLDQIVAKIGDRRREFPDDA